MGVKLLTEHHLEFLSFKGGCTGSSESTLVKCHIVGNHMSWLIYNLCCALNVQRVHLCAALTAISWMLEPFGEAPIQIASRTHFDTTYNKKVIPENQCEKHKKGLVGSTFEDKKLSRHD